MLPSLPLDLGSWFRLACVGVGLALLLEMAARRWLKARRFRSQIDKLPGPPTSSLLLGNIPAKVLSLLLPQPAAAAPAADQTSDDDNNQEATSGDISGPRKAADDFYLSQIQSLLGHTFIYRDKPLFRLWLGSEPVVCVWKPETVEQVLSDNFLLEKSYHYDFLRPWLGDGLLTSPGKIWRPRRKLLVPSFHFNILRAFVPVFDRKSHLLIRNLKRRLGAKLAHTNGARESKSVVVDITPVITACTLDAICETIMGVRIDAQATGENPNQNNNNNNDYCESIYLVGETFLERIIQPRYWLNWLFRYTELGKLYNYHLDKLHSFTRQVIAEKKRQKLLPAGPAGCEAAAAAAASGPVSQLAGRLRALKQSSVDQFESSQSDEPKLPKAFLDLLLDRVLDGPPAQGQQRLSDEQIREEVDTFMFEGHDTTAMALSWTLFLLGHNQDVQRKLQSEVDQLFQMYPELNDTNTNDGDDGDAKNTGLGVDLDHLKQLRYLDCVIKEALRLCPSVPFIGRKTTSELKLAGYTIPAGSVIFVLIYQLHRNSEIFPQPEKFDPDRFLPENTLGRHPFAYVPFSAGPRNCIGQKFAMAEMKTILLHLMKSFTFESVTPLDKARVQMEMVLRPKCPLNIRIKARNTD